MGNYIVERNPKSEPEKFSCLCTFKYEYEPVKSLLTMLEGQVWLNINFLMLFVYLYVFWTSYLDFFEKFMTITYRYGSGQIYPLIAMKDNFRKNLKKEKIWYPSFWI